MKSEIYNELNKKTDYFIHNRVVNNPFKDEIYKEVAEQIFKERNLDSETKQEIISSFPKHLNEVTQMLNSGCKKSEIVDFLLDKRIPNDQAVSIVNEKYETYRKELEIEKKSKTPWLLIFVVGFIIIRWILKFIA